MSLFVERTLTTEIGPVFLAITRAEHVSVQGAPEIRGSKFNVHLHFHRQEDGTYAMREDVRPSMNRAWMSGRSNRNFNDPAPKTYLEKVVNTYQKAVNDHAKAHPEDFTEAEDKDIAHEIARAKSKLADLNSKLQEAQQALDALLVRQAQRRN